MTIHLLPLEEDLLYRLANKEDGALDELAPIARGRIAEMNGRGQSKFTMLPGTPLFQCTKCKAMAPESYSYGMHHDEVAVCLQCAVEVDALIAKEDRDSDEMSVCNRKPLREIVLSWHNLQTDEQQQ